MKLYLELQKIGLGVHLYRMTGLIDQIWASGLGRQLLALGNPAGLAKGLWNPAFQSSGLMAYERRRICLRLAESLRDAPKQEPLS